MKKIKKILLKIFLKKYRLINRTLLSFEKYLSLLFWFIFKKSYFYKYLKMNFGIVNIKPLKIKSWRRGNKYFTAELENSQKKLFLKACVDLDLIKREIYSINMLGGSVKESKNFLPEVVAYNDNSPYAFIALEFIEGNNLDVLIKKNLISNKEKSLIINQMYLVLKLLKKNKIIHRDIRPANIMVNSDIHNNLRIILIDFAYSLFLEKDSCLKIKRTKRDLKLLYELGNGLNPDNLVWDDAYSILLISKKIDSNFKRNYPEIWKDINEMIGDLVYKIEDENLMGKKFKK